MNPCTSSPMSPVEVSRGAATSPSSTQESHGFRVDSGYNRQKVDQLRDLLQSWGVIEMLPHLRNESVTVDELIMVRRHHLPDLLQNFPVGTRIRFEHNLKRWRSWLNVPLQGPQRHETAHCNGCRCGELQTHSQYMAGQQTQMAADNKDKNKGITANSTSRGLLNAPNE